MYYTLYYSLSLVLASLLIEFHLTKSIIAKIIITLVSAALAIFIAGGNFVTGSGYASHSLYGNRMDDGWRGIDLLLLRSSILMIYACAFAFSVFAPGNAVRQATVTDQPNVVSAFFMAIGKSVEFLLMPLESRRYSCLPFSYLFWQDFAPRHPAFKFSHPWLYLLISFLLYCAFFFLNSYAMGTERSQARAQNVYFYVHLWMFASISSIFLMLFQRRAAVLEPVSVAIVNLTEAIKLKYDRYFKWDYRYITGLYWYCLSQQSQLLPTERSPCCVEEQRRTL